MKESVRDYGLTSLILRITITALLGVSIAFMVMDKMKNVLLFRDQKDINISFKDFDTFSYFVAAIAIVGIYNVLQIGPAIYSATTRKLSSSYPFAMYFNLVLDQVSAYLSVSSASAALAAAIEVKRVFDNALSGETDAEFREIKHRIDSFFVKVEIAASLALIASAIMLMLSLMAARFLFKN